MSRRDTLALLLMLGAAVVLALGPLVLPPFYVRVGQLMLYSAGLGVAWAILGGFAGYASFGHAAFIGVGAFTAGLVENQFPALPAPLLLALGFASGGACCAILSALIAWQIRRSRFGAGLLSIREDEDTARMLGVPTERYKRLAFVVSAVLTGMMGVIYAHSLGYITTDSVYRDDTNLSLIVYSLLGGMGTLFGPVIGAGLLVFITQVVLARLLDFHLFATGLLLVLLILLAPGGLLGLLKRRKTA